MPSLTLERALGHAQAALAEARARNLAPMSTAVIDIGGNIVVALREADAGFLGIELATGKARAALAFGCSSRAIADALSHNSLAGPSVLSAAGGRIVLLAGGVLLHDREGTLLGALAMAGDAPDNDEAAATAGAQA